MSVVFDTRQSSEQSQRRPFVQRGTWSLQASCDAKVQRDATLRVSVLAGVVTLALMAAPDFKWKAIDHSFGQSIIISSPEIANNNSGKGLHRVPSVEDGTITASFTRKPIISLDEPVSKTSPKITPLDHVEIIDASTVRAGSRIVRLRGIETPKSTDTCKRLDGLAVSCLDRALSYLQLLVKGRAIACSSTKPTETSSDEGHCRFGETDVAEQLVRQGWAKAGALSEERIVTAELAAKRQKLGIWRQ